MTSENVLLEKFKVLPPDLKQEAIHFVEFLESKITLPKRKKSLKSVFSDLNIKVSNEDIREARNEMWGGYTKDTENEK